MKVWYSNGIPDRSVGGSRSDGCAAQSFAAARSPGASTKVSEPSSLAARAKAAGKIKEIDGVETESRSVAGVRFAEAAVGAAEGNAMKGGAGLSRLEPESGGIGVLNKVKWPELHSINGL